MSIHNPLDDWPLGLTPRVRVFLYVLLAVLLVSVMIGTLRLGIGA